MLLSVQFPSWLKPEIIPGLPVRWYGLMYIIAFGVAFLLYRRQVRERNFPITEDELSGLFFWGILALVLGARIFSALVYETDDIYRKAPWRIFWPFRDGRFTGFQGMSYHGGVIGGLTAILVYSARKKFDYREIGDMFAASIPLGYTFGRLGNFINAELYGRITGSPLGMIFPHGGVYPGDVNYAVIRDGAARLGLEAVPGFNGVLNYPRHPSQLYEALFEGIILWAVIWFFRNRKPFKGFLITLYLSGYGLFRFFLEYFREPDAGLGYRIELVKNDLPPALAHPLLSFSTGQILSFGMILLGLAWAFIASRLPGREPVRVYPNAEEQAAAKAAGEKKQQRKNRRRMQRHISGKK
ncbi:MAG: prolipoprotein diacylglyceryl transferase [Treponema sp.]|jgi:phosphatidylglycerol:prolipoprotein diacylglycerol transferase|nr:prolipoprotein diacylglyceryl transferase [Treponema sp.]